MTTRRAEQTVMFAEAAEAAQVAERQGVELGETIARLGERLRALDPPAGHHLRARQLRSCGNLRQISRRNPHSHARGLVRPVHQLGLRHRMAQTGRRLVPCHLAVRAQSGPACLGGSGTAGGCVRRRDRERSAAPLADLADLALPMLAGSERSVAATKSFIASLLIVARMVAAWSNDDDLGAQLAEAPRALRAAWAA
jgi:glucosamine--fructose-6-phosphate aminotransferase (isomerizing)